MKFISNESEVNEKKLNLILVKVVAMDWFG